VIAEQHKESIPAFQSDKQWYAETGGLFRIAIKLMMDRSQSDM
jgi:hypothetical protein